MIIDKLKSDLKESMLARDGEKTTVLRGLVGAIKDFEINERKEPSEEEQLKIISKEAKKRNEAIKIYEEAKDEARANQEKYELELISNYLPEAMSEDETVSLVEAAIKDVGAESMADTGKVIAQVMKNAAGKSVDGGMVARLVKEKLG